jgi:hypothetical protein
LSGSKYTTLNDPSAVSTVPIVFGVPEDPGQLVASLARPVMPKFVPTDEQRDIVRRAAGFGLPQEYICELVVSERTKKPVSLETLGKHFRTELDHGKNYASFRVINALFDKAVNGDTAACIWWTKTQCGWRDTTNLNVSHEVEYDKMSDEEIIKAPEERANRLGVKINLRESGEGGNANDESAYEHMSTEDMLKGVGRAS